MHPQKKYKVKERNKLHGYCTSAEIINLLKARSLNMMCKVKIDENWVKMSEFVSLQDNTYINISPNSD